MSKTACAGISGAAAGDEAFVLDEGIFEAEDGDAFFDAAISDEEVGGYGEALDAFFPEVFFGYEARLWGKEDGLGAVEADFFHDNVGKFVVAENFRPVVGGVEGKNVIVSHFSFDLVQDGGGFLDPCGRKRDVVFANEKFFFGGVEAVEAAPVVVKDGEADIGPLFADFEFGSAEGDVARDFFVLFEEIGLVAIDEEMDGQEGGQGVVGMDQTGHGFVHEGARAGDGEDGDVEGLRHELNLRAKSEVKRDFSPCHFGVSEKNNLTKYQICTHCSMTTISHEAQAQTDSLTDIEKTSQGDLAELSGAMPSQEFSDSMRQNLMDETNFQATDAENEAAASRENSADSQKGFRMRFKNLTPLRKKTLELLRENPDLDGLTADRLAREALGLIVSQPSLPLKAKSLERTLRSRPYVPAPGNFGTFQKNYFNKDSILEKMENLPLVDRKEAMLSALSAAAQKSRRR